MKRRAKVKALMRFYGSTRKEAKAELENMANE